MKRPFSKSLCWVTKSVQSVAEVESVHLLCQGIVETRVSAQKTSIYADQFGILLVIEKGPGEDC